MKKVFVLDTNVILQTPYSLFYFDEHDIVIADIVLEELDRFKSESSELGAHAREAARILDELREKGDLLAGVSLPSGGKLRIELNHVNIDLPEGWQNGKNDNRILRVCKGLIEQGENAILVSKDVFLRIKAEVIGIPVQDFFAEQVPRYDEQYRGVSNVYVNDNDISEFYKSGTLSVDQLSVYDQNHHRHPFQPEVNEFLIIKSDIHIKNSALGRYDGKNVVPLQFDNEKPFGVNARSVYQKFIQESLMIEADKAPLVIIKGPAGTAKTFYSLAVGLHKILHEHSRYYRKILVCRPNIKMDEDIGFLPGTEEEKIAPFMRPIIDNLEVLMDLDMKRKYSQECDNSFKIQELFDNGIITTEAIAFIRGRSIVNQWVLIDEAQNLTPGQVKGIITRAGNGTKIILAGDPAQIDHPFLDSRTNGLSFASEKMKGSALSYQVSLSEKECERSALAYESSKRM